MRKIIYLVIICLLVGCKPAENYTLSIVHTNDLHAHLLPFNDHEDCAPDSECLGGFARIAAFMNQEKKQNPATLFLDAGDRFTGTAFYALTKSRFLLPLFKMMPYDAAALGNHEFDDNLDETISFISQWPVPTVAANLKISPREKLYQHIRSSVVVEKNKRKIGIVGVITPEINVLGERQISVMPIKKSVAAEVKKLKRQKVDIIVVLSHIGLSEDVKLAKAVPDIDIIVGGHSHSLLINDKNNPIRRAGYPMVMNGGRTLIVSCGLGGQYVGKLQAEFDAKGHIIGFSGDAMAMSTAIPNDAQAEKIIDEASGYLQGVLHEKIATLPQTYGYTEGKNYCSEECAVGEYLSFLLAREHPKVDAVLINSGSIRSMLSAGEMTYSHLLDFYPYDSPAVILKLSGAELKNYLRHGIAHYHKRDKTNELLQTFGVQYAFTTDNKEVLNVKVGGKPLDMKKTYKVLTSLFLADGGDGYPMKPFEDTGLTIREILVKQLKNEQNLRYKPQRNVQIFQK